MRLFAYYTIHSFINTIKKLFKTWLAIFFIAIIFGVVVGIVASIASKSTSEKGNPDSETQIEMTIGTEDASENFLSKRGIDKNLFVDFVVSVTFIVLILLNLLSSSKMGNLFKPGDIVMLFSAPLKPQSVLMFRLMGAIGTSLIISLYMLFQLPNLIGNLKLSPWAAFAFIIAYAYTLIQGTIFQVTFYTISSVKGRKTKDYNKFILAVLGIIAFAFVIYTNRTNADYLTSAVSFFAGSKTFFVPFWGWLRAMCYYAMVGENLKSMLFLALLLVATVVTLIVVWQIKCDFYEDAICSVEKQAALLENAKNSANGAVMQRTKERNGKVNREGFAYGYGASVFFFKPLYNRIRLSKLKFFSTTSIVYIGIAALATYFLRDLTENDPFIFIGCILCAMVFYRTLGNPLAEDINKAFYVMIPERAHKKLMYSVLAGSVTTLMDVLIPIVGTALVLHTTVLNAISWTLLILAIDFFGTMTGSFISVSVPGEAGKGIKLIAQICFLYFGLVPSVVMIALGAIFGQLALFTILAVLVNFALGSIFFAITPLFLEGGNK